LGRSTQDSTTEIQRMQLRGRGKESRSCLQGGQVSKLGRTGVWREDLLRIGREFCIALPRQREEGLGGGEFNSLYKSPKLRKLENRSPVGRGSACSSLIRCNFVTSQTSTRRNKVSSPYRPPPVTGGQRRHGTEGGRFTPYLGSAR